ncbi:unnamed protein product [Lathyrus oleraceus]|uniref:Bromo domain-containing protein n=1 Tax=Pisum sativum TaxID=3888 RepID=A0A9D4Y4P3_PEA|nr:uncharacterized protein LOC127117664 [Pisum sativum]KAI5432958.1 hypothetical protein KIW84_020314 [Pisum sativum]
MGQIVRRKKKGRPSKADLARRSGQSPVTSQSDLRRSRRRRNVRYNIDYDDYIDEEDEEEDEDERRREKKKLKLVEKLNQGVDEEEDEDEEDSAPSRGRPRVAHARSVQSEKRKFGGKKDDDEEEYEEEREEEEEEVEEENENAEEHEDEEEGEAERGEAKGIKVESKGLHSVPGTPLKVLSVIPLPDKRTLELILDKLQKKDTYGVYAEPVDPEELPDYHDVIDNPMDFATVRNKLANGSYTTLEQFESDVFLICSNAMQYNSSDTIYHKQARSIQELARKKFEKLRINLERTQSEQKSEQKTRSNSLGKNLAKRPLGYASQEPVASDFFSGATLPTTGDVLPISHPMQGIPSERPGNIEGLVAGNTFFIDGNQEKAEDFMSGKGLLSKMGRKSSVQDYERKSYVQEYERRATYNMSNPSVTGSDSVFTTFESEIKQLVTVGLQAEYSYARSLARYAATLGPTAWKIASQRIQQALPSGCKFGRGWVGEYEPLPTPVLMLDNRVQKQHSLSTTLQSTSKLTKVGKDGKNVESTLEHPVNELMFEGKQPSIRPGSVLASEVKPSLFGSAGLRPNTSTNLTHQQPNVQTRNIGKSENKGLKQVELNSLPSSDQNNVSLVAKLKSNAPAAVSKPREMVPSNMNILTSMPFKQPDANGVVSGELPNGNVRNPSFNRRMTAPSSESTSTQTVRSAPFVTHGQEQSLSDPVQMMRMLSEKAQKQQASSSSNHPPTETPPVQMMRMLSEKAQKQQASSSYNHPPTETPPVWMMRMLSENAQKPQASSSSNHPPTETPPVQMMRMLSENAQKPQASSSSNHSPTETPPITPNPPGRREDLSNASAAAARAWMSVGAAGFKQGPENSSSPKSQISAESLYNPAREYQQHLSRSRGEFPSGGMPFQSEKNCFPFQALVPQHHAIGVSQFSNRPMVFPQQVAASDLSRFQMQPPWQAVRPHSQPRQKQESLPPDLNIGFQSPGSPAKQSSGVQVDSQQPDLALQL